MIPIVRAWGGPCEYCGDPHGAGYVCPEREAVIIDLMIECQVELVFERVIEPPAPQEPETAFDVWYSGIQVVPDDTIREGTYLAIDRSQSPQFSSEIQEPRGPQVIYVSSQRADFMRALQERKNAIDAQIETTIAYMQSPQWITYDEATEKWGEQPGRVVVIDKPIVEPTLKEIQAVNVTTRKLMGRVRITQEAFEDASPGFTSFSSWWKRKTAELRADPAVSEPKQPP